MRFKENQHAVLGRTIKRNSCERKTQKEINSLEINRYFKFVCNDIVMATFETAEH